ncbi:MAG: ribosome-associated translation inhibitor RaiA [Deltaproteobacteria bacterium]|nr:ribosome-associated translation inhibitor RaiA [Deltaproteobacteria bacterium]
MRINVTFRHMEATDALREHAEKRVRRVAKYVHRPIDAHVILSVVKRRHIAEVILKADRTTMTAKEETGDLYSAIDLAGDKLEHRARKHTEKISDHKRPPRSRRAQIAVRDVPPASPVRDVPGLRMHVLRADSFGRRKGPEVAHTRRLPVKPMSVEEAVMQMDLMSNEFLVFRNAATERLSVVYRRKDGDYGLIEPEAD